MTCCDPLVDAEHETLLVSGCFTPEQLQSGVLDGVTCQNVKYSMLKSPSKWNLTTSHSVPGPVAADAEVWMGSWGMSNPTIRKVRMFQGSILASPGGKLKDLFTDLRRLETTYLLCVGACIQHNSLEFYKHVYIESYSATIWVYPLIPVCDLLYWMEVEAPETADASSHMTPLFQEELDNAALHQVLGCLCDPQLL